jgi:hypothetical protein
VAQPLLKCVAMDFVFYCLSCGGPLVARTHLRGTRVECAHCRGGIEAGPGRAVTEAVVSALLDTALPLRPRVLRRVRPVACHVSAGAIRSRPRLVREARIALRR